MDESTVFKRLSPEYEPVSAVAMAISRALSIASSHSCVLYLLPAESEVVPRGSSKVKCFSRCAVLSVFPNR